MKYDIRFHLRSILLQPSSISFSRESRCSLLPFLRLVTKVTGVSYSIQKKRVSYFICFLDGFTDDSVCDYWILHSICCCRHAPKIFIGNNNKIGGIKSTCSSIKDDTNHRSPHWQRFLHGNAIQETPSPEPCLHSFYPLHPCPLCCIDRILTYGTLLDVLWQMYHAWITYGTVRRIA